MQHTDIKEYNMSIKSAFLVFGIILLCNFLFQCTLAVDKDEFYCKSKSTNLYKSACKRCINDADCDYENKLNRFKACHCSNLELLNNDGGKGLQPSTLIRIVYVYTINSLKVHEGMVVKYLIMIWNS